MKRVLVEVLVLIVGLFLFAVTLGEMKRLKLAEVERNFQLEKLSQAVFVEPKESEEIEFSKALGLRLAKIQGEVEQLKERVSRDRIKKEIKEAVKERAEEYLGEIKNASHFLHENRKQFEILKRVIKEQESKKKEEGKRTKIVDQIQMIQKMLLPTVQISGEENVGSGTIVGPSNLKGEDGYIAYILTAYHVVRNIKAENPKWPKGILNVTIYLSQGEKLNISSELMEYNAKLDVALLRIKTKDPLPNYSTLPSENELSELMVWSKVFTVGCPLGNDPIPTGGFISSKHSELSGVNYWMINAPTYFGNSGGGVFDAASMKLIGVFSKIYTHGKLRPVVISHMGLIVPMTKIYKWFQERGFGFLIPKGN